MSVQVNKVTNAAVWLNGVAKIGQASNVELPSLTQTMAEHEGLGMIGKIQLPSGVEAMEATITWNSVYREAMLLAANPNASNLLQIRYSIETHTTEGRVEQAAGVVTMNARFRSLPGGSFSQHENVSLETTLDVYSMKLTIAGETIYDFDSFSNVYKVGGVDIAQQFRQNIGQI